MFGWVKGLFKRNRAVYTGADKTVRWIQHPLTVERFGLVNQLMFEASAEVGVDADAGQLMRELTGSKRFGRLVAILSCPEDVHWEEGLIDGLAKRAGREVTADAGVQMINDFFTMNGGSVWITLSCFPPQILAGLALTRAVDGTK